MNEEELYQLAISDVSTFPLLNEILAIRDNRFPNEKVDYCINVNGCISLDVLNKYVRSIIELEQLKEQLKDENTYCEEANKWYKEAFQLQNNWNELKKWLKQIQDYHIEQRGLIDNEFNYSLESEAIDVLEDVLHKMQELEGNNDSRGNRSN